MIGSDQKRNRHTGDRIGRAVNGSNRTQIRAATVADLAAIIICSDLAFMSFAGYEDSGDVQLAENLQSQILEGSIRLICDGTDVLGYISLWPTADQMFIDTLAVLPMHHRKGLGSQLLAYADFETLRLGLKAITLFTKATMTGNLVFYQSRGYRETGRCDDDGFCRVFYSKAISPLAVTAFSAPPVRSNSAASARS